MVWNEALKISGQDPDFHRRDLWEAIENGDFPEWELGVQIVEEKQQPDALHFINEAYKHCKAIAASGDGCELVEASYAGADLKGTKELPAGMILVRGVATRKMAQKFIGAIAQHRHFSREMQSQVPA